MNQVGGALGEDTGADIPLWIVFQLEAFVPSADGSRLVNIEFATPFESHGPEFRTMLVQVAMSVSFGPPPGPSGLTTKIGQVLG